MPLVAAAPIARRITCVAPFTTGILLSLTQPAFAGTHNATGNSNISVTNQDYTVDAGSANANLPAAAQDAIGRDAGGGLGTTLPLHDTIVVGVSAAAPAAQAAAIGAFASANAAQDITIRISTHASAAMSVALGDNGVATDEDVVSVGYLGYASIANSAISGGSNGSTGISNISTGISGSSAALPSPISGATPTVPFSAGDGGARAVALQTLQRAKMEAMLRRSGKYLQSDRH